MKRSFTRWIAGIACGASLLAGPILASEGSTAAPATEAAEAAATATDAKTADTAENEPLPVYSPPQPVRGSYPRHLAGLGTRSSGPPPSPVRLFALAPNHLGVSVRSQPTLYWYLEGDSALPVEFSMIDGAAGSTALEISFPAPVAAGYYGIRLADHGFHLRTGTIYEWTVALVNGGREVHPTISVGFIDRREPDADLNRELATAGPKGAVHAYANRGLWYEAFDDIAKRIAANPSDRLLWLQRAALLEQVDLAPIADRAREIADEAR